MGEKILAIDGHSMMNRAFYALPDFTSADGRHTGAVYGFLNILFEVVAEEDPQYLVAAFDLHAPTFRHKMYKEYKGTRHPMPEELREQIPLIKEVLAAMNIPVITKEGYEADDILGTVSRKAEKKELECTILSGDRDLLQLATDRTKILLPKTKGGKSTMLSYHAQDVIDEYGITPEQVIEIKALEGDSSDNIPGLPGVGQKTAMKILQQYGTVENAHQHLDELKPPRVQAAFRDHWDQAELSHTLATINTDSPVEVDWDAARYDDPYTPEAFVMFKDLGFRRLLTKFDGKEGTVPEKKCLSVHVLHDAAETEGTVRKASSSENVGLAVLASFDKKSQNSKVFSIACALSEDDIFCIPASDAVSSEQLKHYALEIMGSEKVSTICAYGLKEILRAVESAGGGISEAEKNRIMDPGRYFDAEIMAYLLDPLAGSYSYDQTAARFCEKTNVRTPEEIFQAKKIPAPADMSEEQMAEYCGSIAFTALACREPAEAELKKQGEDRLFHEMEMPLIFTLRKMERAGMRVLPEELSTYGKQLEEGIGRLEARIYEEAGEEFNINSPKQLGVILFEKMGLPGGKKTKTGWSTAADILEKLAPDYPIVKDILDYRQLTKLKSTYADGLSAEIADDGRIHTTFNQTITATGRISSTEPNLQNIPVRVELGKKLRKVFVPSEGCVFVDADYSQIELRVLASLSGDEKLISAYRDAEDIHRITASQVFHVPFDQVTPLQRRRAKAVNFGIVYGISAYGLSQDLDISREEAGEYIQSYYETYPGIKGYLEGLVESAKKKGYSETYYGRRRPMPELKSSNFMKRQFGERVAKNAPIQGTAADIIKIAMNRVQSRLEKENLKARLVLQVHDELLVEAPVEETEQVKKILEEEMTGATDLAVRMEIDVETGSNWYEAH